MEFASSEKRPLVCLFDSGIGGLNLLAACARAMPYADFAYYADNFNVPYGAMDGDEIFRRTDKFFSLMADRRPAAAALACNTATAFCIQRLRQKYSFPIAGIQPPVKQALQRGGMFLVLVTRATYSSASFRALIKRYGSGAVLYPCDNLAESIERCAPEIPAEDFVSGLPTGDYNSVVLGCTHYIFIKKAVEKRYGCPVFDGIAGTADHLRTLAGNFDHQATFNRKIDFFCGDFSKNRKIYEIIQQRLN